MLNSSQFKTTSRLYYCDVNPRPDTETKTEVYIRQVLQS